MRRSAKRFFIRLGIAAVAALALGGLIVLPLTHASVRLIDVMMLPVHPVMDRLFPSTYCFGREIPREAFWLVAWRASISALPAYTAILYLPAVAQLSVRSIRYAFHDRWRATIYAIAGGMLGACLGFFVWLRYGSSAALFLYVAAGAAATAWALILTRAALAEVGLRRSHL